NADLRLTEIGHEIGLIPEERYQKFLMKKQAIEDELERLSLAVLGASREVCETLVGLGSSEIHTATSLLELLRRPELSYESLAPLDPERKPLPADVIEQVVINIRYEGYIERQLQQVEQFKKLENRKIPADFDYDAVPSLRLEARQKLKLFRPVNVGQASRISGVSPADISVLLVFLTRVLRGEAQE
ncbi:MAG: tRNA uridine-5-carboxymethylaminomethyl(34) synthesis enzyme MnmG, partial [Lachnospiraceae bacterium]|nr:tRNA uridine-5-carboxymethylaminomethyl(34) synthesis enzyme MnmG [Lachnospiraceae bacterium]